MKTLHSLIISFFIFSVINSTLTAKDNKLFSTKKPAPLPYDIVLQLVKGCGFTLKKEAHSIIGGLDLSRGNEIMSSTESLSGGKIEISLEYYNYKSLPDFPNNFDRLNLRLIVLEENNKKERDLAIEKYNEYASTLINEFYKTILKKPVSSKLLTGVKDAKDCHEYLGDTKYGSIKFTFQSHDLEKKYVEYLTIDLKPDYNAYMK
jgi:hypothetical protein